MKNAEKIILPKKNRKFTRNNRKTFLFALCAVIFYVVFFLILIVIDKYIYFFGRFHSDNKVSVEVWFSVIATCVATIPGALFGILALVQTQTNYKLESRYHRTYLSIKEAGMTIKWFNELDYDMEGEELLLQKVLSNLMVNKSKENIGFITFYIIFKLENGIEMRELNIKKIDFIFGPENINKKYSFNLINSVDEGLIDSYVDSCLRTFNRTYEDNYRFYKVNFSLYPYILYTKKGVQQDYIDKEEQEFWKFMKGFVSQEYFNEKVFSKLRMNILADISYEYAPNEGEEVRVKLIWDETSICKNDNKFISLIKSTNGYLTYDK